MQQNLSSYVPPNTSLSDVAVANKFTEKAHLKLEYKNTQTTRVVINWQQAEIMPYFYNWDMVATELENGKEYTNQPVWDLCYLGFPDNLTPLQPSFARRFAAFCRAFVRYCKYKQPDAILQIAAINETSFYNNEAYLSTNREARVVLVQACAQAICAMREEHPNICIFTNHPVADIISLLGKCRLPEITLAIAS